MLANWTKATTTTTGTGTITLAAVTGRPLPSKSRTTGEYVQYSIVTSDSKYESGIGKIAASDTLERTKVFSTYDGTTYDSTTATALSLASGTHTVYITPMAETTYEPLRFPLSGPTNPSIFSTHLGTAEGNITLISAERAIAWPFRLETAGIVTSMCCNVAAAGDASSRLSLALYEADSNGRPARRICVTSTVIDSSTTGYKSQAVASNARVTPGWYWIALCVTAGTKPTLTGYSATPIHSAYGSSGKSGICRILENATATSLADPFPSTALVYTTGENVPFIGLILS